MQIEQQRYEPAQRANGIRVDLEAGQSWPRYIVLHFQALVELEILCPMSRCNEVQNSMSYRQNLPS